MVLFVIALLLFFFYYLIWPLIIAKNAAPDPCLPGPKPLPILGNLFELVTSKPHHALMELGKKYGPICKVRLLNENCVVVTGLQLIMEASIEKGYIFSGRPSSFRMNSMVNDAGVLDFGDLDEIGSIGRKISMRSMKPSGEAMSELETVTTDIFGDLLDDWCSLSGTPHHLGDDLARVTCRLMLRLMVGESVGPYSKSVDMLLELEDLHFHALDNSRTGMLLDTYPWLRFLGNKAWTLMKEGYEVTNTFFAIHKEHTEGMTKGDKGHCILHMIMSDTNKAKMSNDKIAKGVLVTLTLGGLTTTGTLLHTFIGVLAHYPHIQTRIQEEIDAVIGDKLPRITDRVNMPYTEATILDVIRNTRILPMTGSHKTMSDTTLGGYDIPEGVTVLLSLWSIHHDPDFWQDPYSYNPERFLDAEGQLVSVDHPNRKHILPFGAGPRSCPAEAFARGRLFMFLTMFCQRFTVCPEGQQDPDFMDPRGYTLHGLIIAPPQQKLILHDRRVTF